MVSRTYSSRSPIPPPRHKLTYKHSFKPTQSRKCGPKGPRKLTPKDPPNLVTRRTVQGPKPPRPFSTYKWYVTTRVQPRHPSGARLQRAKSMTKASLSDKRLSRPSRPPPPPPPNLGNSDITSKKVPPKSDVSNRGACAKDNRTREDGGSRRQVSNTGRKPQPKPKPDNLKVNPRGRSKRVVRENSSLNRRPTGSGNNVQKSEKSTQHGHIGGSDKSPTVKTKPQLKPRRQSNTSSKFKNQPDADTTDTNLLLPRSANNRQSAIAHRTPPLGLGLSFRRSSHRQSFFPEPKRSSKGTSGHCHQSKPLVQQTSSVRMPPQTKFKGCTLRSCIAELHHVHRQSPSSEPDGHRSSRRQLNNGHRIISKEADGTRSKISSSSSHELVRKRQVSNAGYRTPPQPLKGYDRPRKDVPKPCPRTSISPPNELYSLIRRPLNPGSGQNSRSSNRSQHTPPKTPPVPPRDYPPSCTRLSNDSLGYLQSCSLLQPKFSDCRAKDEPEYLEPAPLIQPLCLPRKNQKKRAYNPGPFSHVVKVISSCVAFSRLYHRLRKVCRRKVSR